jgi:hypothetical protein
MLPYWCTIFGIDGMPPPDYLENFDDNNIFRIVAGEGKIMYEDCESREFEITNK